MVKFFSDEEEQRIISAIRRLEGLTSGEIRVHLANESDGDVTRAAQRTFFQLGMHQTQERNGVLFFLVPKHHEFAIIGDKGIHERVPNNFWNEVRDLAQRYFRSGEFVEGICRAVDRIGEKLREFFPVRHDDANELPDDISYG
jgi:uncharacterized membrane protein